MNTTTMAFATVVGTVLCLDPAALHADTITMKEALDRAARRPSVLLARLDLDEARANVRGANLPAHNPELTVAAGPQFGTSTLVPDLQIGLSQIIERGGKRSARVDVAEADAHAVDSAGSAERFAARIEAWRAFERTLVLRERVETQRQVEQLATALATALQRAAQAGGATKLRVNVVLAEAGRATQTRIAAEAEYATAIVGLATAIGAGPNDALEPIGQIGELPSLPTSVDDLVARALRSNPKLALGAAQAVAVRARIDVADSLGVSDVRLGVGYAYSPSPDGSHAIVASLSVPLAVRNRNEGERAAARIRARHADDEQLRARVEVERQVRLAFDNYRRAREAVAAFDRGVGDQLSQNLSSAQEAFTKGGMDFVELTVTQRDLVDARLAHLEATATAIDAWAELAFETTIEVAP